MKRRVLSLLLAFSMMLQMMSGVAMAADYPVPTIGAQDALEKYANGTPMSVSHRAAWRNGPECSVLAIYHSIMMGIDVVEVDVKVTSDGVAVLMHDTDISRTTTGSGGVESMTWEQLLTYPSEDGQGSNNVPYKLTAADVEILNGLESYVKYYGQAEVGGTMPTTRLEVAIELIQKYGPKTMINWDHCTTERRFVESYILFREAGMLDNVFFKNSNGVGTQNAWYDAAASAWNTKHPDQQISADDVKNSILYVYIIRSADPSPLQAHLDNGDNLVMTEICIADDATDAAIEAALEPWCKEKGIAMFINTMWSGLCSTKADTETTWAEMLDRGYVAIQTDQASELAEYLNAYNNTRNASSVIEAEHFHNFNYDDYGLKVAESADASLNKKVEGMESGDWMEYRKINFDGSEVMLNLNMRGQAVGVLSVYLDGMSAENLIAQIDLSAGSGYQLTSAELKSAVTAGEHNVYLQVSGTANAALVSIDNFQFVSSSAFEGNVEVTEVAVTTQVGTAPELPGHVEVIVNAGTESEAVYGLEVRWEQVAAEAYASVGSFTVLGYVPVLSKYIEATVTVTESVSVEPGTTEDGLVLWLDASKGIEAENGAVKSWTSQVGTSPIVVTVNSGSPTLVANAAGSGSGIYFDGNDSLAITMPENFWNSSGEDANYTVLMFTASEQELKFTDSTEVGVHGSNRSAQYNSVMYFGENADWGSVHFGVAQNQVNWRFGSGTSGDRGDTYIRSANLGAIFTATAVRKQGMTDTLFIDGEWIYSGSSDRAYTTNNLNTGWIGLGKEGNYYKGTICEILIYDRALTDAEIVAAQQAMAEKYADPVKETAAVEVTCEAGTAPELPDTVEVTYESGRKAEIGVTWEKINPNNYVKEGTFEVKGTLATGEEVVAKVTVTVASSEVTGEVPTKNMLFWMSASEGVETDENGKILGWTSVGEGYTATPKLDKGKTHATLKTDAVNGNPAVVFDGNNVLQLIMPEGTFNGLEGATVIAYTKSATDLVTYSNNPSEAYSAQRNTLFTVDEAGTWGSVYVGIYTDEISARFGTGTAQDNGFYQARGEKVTDYTATVVRWNGENKSYDVDVDGVDFGTGSSKATMTKNNANIVYLGTGKSNTFWTGELCELIVYDCTLSDTQLESIYNYLEEKYVPEEEPVEDATVKTDGLALWLDASEVNTLTTEDGKVSAWASKVAYNGSTITASVSADSSKPTWVANAAGVGEGVKFDGTSDYLDIDMPDGFWNKNDAEYTVIMYVSSNDTTRGASTTGGSTRNAQFNNIMWFGESDDWGSVYFNASQNEINWRFGSGESNDYGTTFVRPSNIGDAYTATVIRKDGTANTVFVDGTQVYSGTSKSANTKNNKNVDGWIGRGKNENGATHFEGTICELLIYDHALTNAEIESINNYLAEKYDPANYKNVTGIYLEQEGQQITLYKEETSQLTASTIPANAENTALTYTSSNSAVATVDEYGVITAVGWGYATITVATVDGNYQATCTVFVDKTEAEKIWQNIQDILAWADAQDTEGYLNWDDTMGNAVTEFAASGVTETSEVAVLREEYNKLRAAMLELLEPVEYEFTEATKNQTVEAGAELTVEILPDNQYLLSVQVDGNTVDKENYTVTSGYEDPYYNASRSTTGMKITLSEAYMSTITQGEHTLTVAFANAKTNPETSFTVVKSLTKVELTAEKTELVLGSSMQLTTVFTPADATNTEVTYTSSNPAIATVDASGKVIAVGKGTVTITVTTEDGALSASIEIKVTCNHPLTYTTGKKDATCTSDGYTGDQICKTCGEVAQKGRTVSKTGHSYSNNTCTKCGAGVPGTTTGTQTGDTANLTLWITLICVAGGMVVCLVGFKRKTRN